MAKRRKRKKKKIKVKVNPETLSSVAAVVSVIFGLLVVVSFTGQGTVLSFINSYLTYKIGLGVLFLPFVFISSGLVMLRAQWEWSKPSVLLGTLLLMTGAVGMAKSGTIGANTFENLARLISPLGSYIVFGGVLLIGALIISQISIHEIAALLAKMREKRH